MGNIGTENRAESPVDASLDGRLAAELNGRLAPQNS
jgi:hypothetical protein